MKLLQRPRVPNVALVYSSKTTTREDQAAAMRGLERFTRFGLLVDSLDVETQRVGQVKCGTALKSFATSITPLQVVNGDLTRLSLANAWHTLVRDQPLATGIAITSSQLTGARYDDEVISEAARSVGLSKNGGAAVVNVRAFDFIEDEAVRDMAIRLAIIHELGHVFGIAHTHSSDANRASTNLVTTTGHCTATNCVMQENNNKEDFVARFVIPGLDFCGNCVTTITREIRRLTEPRMYS